LFYNKLSFVLKALDKNSILHYWKVLTSEFNEDLKESYRMIHQAVQFLAISGKSIVLPRFDDSHTSFTWDFGKKCFAGEWFNGSRTLRLEFDPVELCLNLVPYGEKPANSLYFEGKTKKEVYAHLRHMLLNEEVKIQHFANEMHYDLPQHEVCRGGKYRISSINMNREIVKHYSNAYLLLNMLKGRSPLSGPIRCWPHHFDITAEFPNIDSDGKISTSYSVGFSPANPDFPEPYFYVTLRSNSPNFSIKKQKLKNGSWLPGNILGTSLGLQRVVKKTSAQTQIERLIGFMEESQSQMQN